MIRALSNLGKALRAEQNDNRWSHDALKMEPISIELVINKDGGYEQFNIIEKILIPAEGLSAKKGKARLLLDKAGEVLCYGGKQSKKKHQLFLAKLDEYKELSELAPVMAFYNKNRKNGYEKALESFEAIAETDDKKIKKIIAGNIGFKIITEGKRIGEKDAVLNAVIEKYELLQKELILRSPKSCSICGTSDFAVLDAPHGMIKRIPDGQPSGCALVSYNENAFLSYGLKGNRNSSICTNCAKTYVEGLNWLLSTGNETFVKTKQGKGKTIFRYSNRKNFGSDTAIVFWTRKNQKVEEIELLDAPDAGEVAKIIDSVTSGTEHNNRYLETEQFYSCILSGSAARIAVRDWIETSLEDFKKSLAHWFQDIAVDHYDRNINGMQTVYTPLFRLARSCQRQRLKNDGKYEYDKDDSAIARVAATLWNAALKNTTIPLWILSKTLQRSRLSRNGVTSDRAALIKIILNRNNQGEKFMITENKVEGEKPAAYVCGQIFAKLEGIQYATLGQVNAGIREKYFTFAMTTPAAAFGRLFNLSSKHFTKLKSKKPGLAVNLDKELQELCKDIDILSFPQFFQLEEQGQFAIGYYHQKQEDFTGMANNGGNENE